MNQSIVQVDAFTAEPFAGNPAAVCVLKEPADETWMQRVALEMNLSETAFLVPRPDGYDLRWFTPTKEVDLCGHATLASAHVLWEDGDVAPDATCRFHTRSGLLEAEKNGDWIRMSFPNEAGQPIDAPAGLAGALGLPPVATQVNRLRVCLAEFETAEQVRNLTPDLKRLKELPYFAFIATSASDDDRFDFISRFFAPSAGVDEDPVTGSAHCMLGPLWAERLRKHDMVAYQASARGGVVNVTVDGDRVYLGGQAVMVMRGTLLTTRPTLRGA